MSLVIIDKMIERVDHARGESDSSLFQSLLLLGELVTKVVTAGVVAGLDDDVDGHRYQQLHRLVRADGIGEWSAVLESALSGPASQHLAPELEPERRELTQPFRSNDWQYEAVNLIQKSLQIILPNQPALNNKVEGKRWFKLFAQLRNKTRGHGATTSEASHKISVLLEESIRLVIANSCLFRREWAYVRMNVSSRYSIVPMAQSCLKFSSSPNKNEKLEDGIYIYYDRARRVELIHTTIDLADFSFPNGGYTDNTYEALSYLTDKRVHLDASPYRKPVTPLPSSETEGLASLDIQGNAFGNLPPMQKNYINRPKLEKELKDVLLNDRHPIITLSGRGGIGKTTLALSTLHDLLGDEEEHSFEAIVWFSARDIDLLTEGPKQVKPNVLSEKDVARDFARLMNPSELSEKNFDALSYFGASLRKSSFGPVLFVFDNFETVSNPSDFFSWLDTYVRLPNKLLITTRVRHFKADYPIEVGGMEDSECEKLIDTVSSELKIGSLLTKQYRQDLLVEADGHPYVVKMLLGEVAKAGKLIKIDRIVASKEGVLDALFERTYNSLSLVAQRVFLTLCNWRAILPQLAIEAVLLRPTNDKMDVARGLDELQKSSFIEITVSEKDDMAFVSVPLVASVFGRKKLSVSSLKSAVQADTELLHCFGAAAQIDIRHGVGPRIERMFSYIRDHISGGNEPISNYLPIVKFIARQYPSAWLSLADLYQTLGSKDDYKKAQEAVNCFLQAGLTENERRLGWSKLAQLCRRNEYYLGEAQALVEGCRLPNTPFYILSEASHRINTIFNYQYLVLDSDHKQFLVRQLAELMEGRVGEADANACSRLAWLYIILKDKESAREAMLRGLTLDPTNEHCKKLGQRFLSP